MYLRYNQSHHNTCRNVLYALADTAISTCYGIVVGAN